MGYTNRREKMKWRDKNTKKLKYYSSVKFDEHNNKFSTGWFPDSNFFECHIYTRHTNNKIDPYYHPFIKYDILE